MAKYCQIWLALLATIFAILINNGQSEQTDSPIVQLSHGGWVHGIVQQVPASGTTGTGGTVNFYQAIRYGRAERFRKPVPVEPWQGVYDATRVRYQCPQPPEKNPVPIPASEDCLFLNVWQPVTAGTNTNGTGKLPVMFWIHGGSFYHSSIYEFDARRMSHQGQVIVVSVNFRIGLFGFLYGGTAEEPGNLALHDMIMGLRWVHDNIHQFGGDPGSVTIFGTSAGGSVIGQFMLSPLTQGLFHRAILQSGCPIGKMGSNSKQESLRSTMNYARKLNCQNLFNNLKWAIKCMKGRSVEELVKIQLTANVIYGDEIVPVQPSEAVKTYQPGNIDLMFGVVRNEGTNLMDRIFPQIDMDNISVRSAQSAINTIMQRMQIPKSYQSKVYDYYSKRMTPQSTKDELR